MNVCIYRSQEGVQHRQPYITTSEALGYGLRNTTHTWFHSYLTDRSQRTMVNGSFSQFAKSVCGVPQGSVLGPLLFLLYINDIAQVVGEEHIYLYADDTVLYVSGNNLDIVQAKLQKILDQFVMWSHMNKLTLNTQKTKTMTFFPSRNKDSNYVTLSVGNYMLDNVSSYKYLGYLLDER